MNSTLLRVPSHSTGATSKRKFMLQALKIEHIDHTAFTYTNTTKRYIHLGRATISGVRLARRLNLNGLNTFDHGWAYFSGREPDHWHSTIHDTIYHN
jgi:hypothetical protein